MQRYVRQHTYFRNIVRTLIDWVDKEDPNGKYCQYKQRYMFNELHRIQSSLMHTITTRALELHAIHARIRGHKASRKFIGYLNQCWKTINKDINEFNSLIKHIPENLRPNPLNMKDIKEKGVLLDTFWDINRVQINEDWALSSQVREGMETHLRVNRAQEEVKRIQLEVDRLIDWLATQVEEHNIVDE